MKLTLSTVLVIFSCALAILASTPVQILADINQIITLSQKLDTDTKGISSTNIVSALAIHTDAGNLITTINTATSDTKAVILNPISESDGESVLEAWRVLEVALITCLSDIASKKDPISAIPITGLVSLILQDLKDLQTALIAFENAVLAATPSDIKTELAPIFSAINNALTNVILAYSK